MEYNVFQNNKLLDKLKDDKEWKLYNLLDIFQDDTKNALKIKKEEYLLEGENPIVDQGQPYIGGYTNRNDKLYKNIPSIIFGDHTRIIKYVDFPMFIGADGVKLLKPTLNNKELNVKYVYYFLKSIELPSDGYSRHFKYLKQLVIPVPIIIIQNKIVDVLDKAQEVIDKRKEQIEVLDELVKSRFIEMFGDPITNSKCWKVKLLGEVCEMKAGKNIKASDIYYENSGNLYPCYGGNGLRGYVENYSYEGNIPLIGRQGALCGNVKYAQGKFYATEHAVVTQPKVEMNTHWLYFLLSQLDLNRLSTGAAQPGLTVGKLNLVEIPISPLDMQNEFEKFANQVDKLKFEMESSLKELENNFNSLMQSAFKGELFY